MWRAKAVVAKDNAAQAHGEMRANPLPEHREGEKRQDVVDVEISHEIERLASEHLLDQPHGTPTFAPGLPAIADGAGFKLKKAHLEAARVLPYQLGKAIAVAPAGPGGEGEMSLFETSGSHRSAQENQRMDVKQGLHQEHTMER
jgi:hypothetical protein